MAPQQDKPVEKPVEKKADPQQTHVTQQWKYTSPLISCRFDPTGRYVLAGAEDNTVQRWDMASGKNTPLAAHDSWVRAIGFSPDGQTTLTGGCDGRLIWWPTAAEKPAPLRKIDDAHSGWIRTLSVSPDGSLIATGGNDHLVKLWSLADGKPVRQLSGHTSHVYSTLFHPNGQLLLSGDLEGKVIGWDVATGKQLRSFDAKDLHTYHGGQQAHYGGVRSLSLSPGGKHLAGSGLYKATNPFGAVQSPLAVRFEWESQKQIQSHITQGDIKAILWRAVFHPDGFLLGAAGGGAGGFLLFWQADKAEEFHRFKLPNTARDMDLHGDALQIATAHYDRHLRISRMAKG